MDFSIASILLLDGVTNGAIYALLAMATVLVFAVTRVIFIPQGEFVAFGALTVGMFQAGRVPGTVWLLLAMAVAVAVLDIAEQVRQGVSAARITRHARPRRVGSCSHRSSSRVRPSVAALPPA